MQTSPEGQIRARIASRGQITFAEFMEVALYHPSGGYYALGASDGVRRDYFTSPGAHPAFGALIAVQLWRMWEVMGRPPSLYAIEMGAGDGLLARDVVGYAGALPGPFQESLRYIAIDRSLGYAARDRDPGAFQRIVASGIPFRGVVGCLLSNEMVDSFPVHRFQIQNGTLKEVFVSVRDGQFVEVLGEPSTPLLAHRIEGLGLSLPEGYQGEVNLEIGPWMAAVAGALKSGFVLTIDYGYEAPELYSPQRAGGTVQTYHRHTQAASPYRRTGMQDITAHVDFSTVASEGEAVGLRPLGLLTQSQYLRGLGLERWLRKLRTEELTQRERDANMMGMRELVGPDGLGGFKVLVQEKGLGPLDLGLLAPSEAPMDALTVPLLRPDHIPLMPGRYPHAGWQWEKLWPQGEQQT